MKYDELSQVGERSAAPEYRARPVLEDSPRSITVRSRVSYPWWAGVKWSYRCHHSSLQGWILSTHFWRFTKNVLMQLSSDYFSLFEYNVQINNPGRPLLTCPDQSWFPMIHWTSSASVVWLVIRMICCRNNCNDSTGHHHFLLFTLHSQQIKCVTSEFLISQLYAKMFVQTNFFQNFLSRPCWPQYSHAIR